MVTGRTLLKTWKLCKGKIDLFGIPSSASLLEVPGVAALGLRQDDERPSTLEALRAIEHYDRERASTASAKLAITAPPLIRSGATTREVLERLVKSAKVTILVIGFQISESSFVGLLKDAGRRGVKVTVIADRDSDDARELFESWPYGITAIEAWRGIEMRNRCLLHAKVIVIDDVRALIGSANFTAGGLRNNLLEVGVEVEGPTVAQLSQLADELKNCGLLERIA